MMRFCVRTCKAASPANSDNHVALLFHCIDAAFGVWLEISTPGAGPSHGSLCKSGPGWCLCQESPTGRGLPFFRTDCHHPKPGSRTHHHHCRQHIVTSERRLLWHVLGEGDSKENSKGTEKRTEWRYVRMVLSMGLTFSKKESVWCQFPVEESGDFPSYGLNVFASADLFLLLVQD